MLFIIISNVDNKKQRFKINMTKKKFSGRKMEATKLGFHIAGKDDEEREIYSSEDCMLAHYLKKHLNNDIQEQILSYIGEVNVKYEEEYDDEIEMYECEFYDDFILNEQEIVVDEYKNNCKFKNYYYEIENLYD
tara:strand:+ start:217 stop:618 length:402 start_codon:yes stop_codon:yes gene_type:complete